MNSSCIGVLGVGVGMGGWGYDIDKISQLIYCHRDCEASLAPLHLFPQLNISHLLTHVKWIDQFADSTHLEKVPPLKKNRNLCHSDSYCDSDRPQGGKPFLPTTTKQPRLFRTSYCVRATDSLTFRTN